MTINPVYFQILSPQQANPLGYGALQGTQMANNILAARSQAIQNRYMPQNLQSEIALKQAQANAQNSLPGLYGAEGKEALARAAMANAQGNLLSQETPYLVQQQQGAVYKDPILSRLFELQKAQQTGAISPNLLSSVGFGGAPATGTTAPMDNGVQSVFPALNATPAATPMTAPNLFSGNNPQSNWALFGSPLSPMTMMQLHAYGKGLDTQATTGVTQYNDAQKSAAQNADLGTQISQLVNQFQNNYDKTDLKGPALGRMPAITSAAQATDNASQNMAAMVAKLIAGGRVTNYEMQYINHLKPNRTMSPQAAQMISDYLKQKSIRMTEEQDFLNAARARGVDIQTANSLWQKYNNQRPVYNFAQNKANTQFQKSWRDYLTPEAVIAVKTGQNYVPMPNFSSKSGFQNWYQTLNPSDQATVRSQLVQQGGQ